MSKPNYFQVIKVFLEYDGPRLMLVRERNDQQALAWWSDTVKTTDRWIYLLVSDERLADILEGRMASYDAINSPEGGQLYMAFTDLGSTDIRTIQPIEWYIIDSHSMPQPGSILNIKDWNT